MEKGSRSSSPSPNQPPISREQALLESFFHTLSQFAFDKAKDQVEKEKEAKRLPLVSSTPWSLLMVALSHLALAEKMYFSLPFIAKKFLRKDSVRDSFKSLTTELKRIEETVHTTAAFGSPVEGSLMAELCRHLCQFVQARQELINFYEAMATMSSSSNVNCADFSNMIDEICRRHNKGFHHPILDSIKSSFSYEVDILSNLLKAQCDMAEWKFLPSLLHLHESHVKLSSWCHVFPSGELGASLTLKKSLFGSTSKKHVEAPFLYQWLGKLQDAVVSKMEWTEQKDVMLAREILLCEPFQYRVGSKERGSVWSQIATNLNTHPGFTVSQRAVRDRYGILEKKAKKRKREIENGTGISPEDSELDLALEEIIEKWEAADQDFQLDNQSKAKKLEKDKETAEDMRRMSMETLGASKNRKSDPDESAEEKRCKRRRGGSDTVQFLKEHSEMEFTFKREELEAKKSEQSLLTEQQKQQQQMISMFQQQLQQQNQQQQLQQQQMQQQLQQMQTMFMESQKQQAQLMATLFQKMSEHK